MNARSALFDLYGDHLRSRGGRAPVAALVRMLAALDIAAPAVRTAVSRMVHQGWLTRVRLTEGPGYALSLRGLHRLDEAAARIYGYGQVPWDGTWHMLVVERIRDRAQRDRVRAGLSYLGYAPLDDTTWIGPRRSPELDELLDGERVRAEQFSAVHDGDSRGLVARAWDLDGLARAYRRWLTDAEELLQTLGDEPCDEKAFATRSKLVHEWRKFLFRDPGLPPELLPPDWAGTRAALFFDTESRRLLPAASRFVDACLNAPNAAGSENNGSDRQPRPTAPTNSLDQESSG